MTLTTEIHLVNINIIKETAPSVINLSPKHLIIDSNGFEDITSEMPFYNNSYKTLEELEKDYYQAKAPKVFSFAGILARICLPSDRPEDNSLEVRF